MGWLWSSSPPPSSGEPPSVTKPSTASPSHPPPPPTSSASPGSSSSSAGDHGSKLNPDELELQKFFTLLQEDSLSSLSKTASAQTPTDPQPNAKPSLLSSWKTPWSSAGAESEDEAEPSSPFSDRERSLAEAVLPTSMSCQQAFDLAWGCQSPVGQWRAVYRHGNVRPCSDLWEDFWFCMRVKSFSPGLAKDEAIRSHYRKRELEKYYAHGRRSSEDVWRSRTLDEVLPPSAVFNQPFQAALDGGISDTPAAADADTDSSSSGASTRLPASERSDAEKIRADLERRRLIRQQMGYEK